MTRLRFARRIVARFAVVLGLSVAGLGVGCTSQDRHVFESPSYRPVTVTVLDGVTREPLWSYDIPAGHILTIDTDADLRPQQNYAGGNRATQMAWEVRDPGAREGPFDIHLANPIEKGLLEFDEPKNLLMSYDLRVPGRVATADRFTRDDLPVGQPVPAVVEPVEVAEPVVEPAAAVEEPKAAMAEPADEEPAMATPVAVEPAEEAPAEPGAVSDEIDLLEGAIK
ncbi:MAG: hypothetical protein AAF823_15510 [Planctomycetota bacterium]